MDQSQYPGGFTSSRTTKDGQPISNFHSLEQQYRHPNVLDIGPPPVDAKQQQMTWMAQTQQMQYLPGWYDDQWMKNQANQTIPNFNMPLVQCKDEYSLDYQYLDAYERSGMVGQPSPQLSESASQRSSLSSPYPLSEYQAYAYFGNIPTHTIKTEDGTGRLEQVSLEVFPLFDENHGTSEAEDCSHSYSRSPITNLQQYADMQKFDSSKAQDEPKIEHSPDGSCAPNVLERRKRSHTTEENAKCYCKTCGKLFKRIYNLNAHLDTHLKSRPHPYSCPHQGCDKRFVRRTDLARHEQSVRKLDN